MVDNTRQDSWIDLQDDIQEAYGIVRSMLDAGGVGVVGIDTDSNRELFKRISDARQDKTIQKEFNALRKEIREERAADMLQWLMQFQLVGNTAGKYLTDADISRLSDEQQDAFIRSSLADMVDYSEKVGNLPQEQRTWVEGLDKLIYDLQVMLVQYLSQGAKQKYTEGLVTLFNGHEDYIDKLCGLSDNDIADNIRKWSKLRLNDDTFICQNPANNNASAFANELKRNNLIRAKVDTFRKKL